VTEIRKPSLNKSIVEIDYADPQRESDHIEGIHQILMISQDHLMLTYGAEVATLPYDAVEKITLKFNYDSD
jgi:hypothetical protein